MGCRTASTGRGSARVRFAGVSLSVLCIRQHRARCAPRAPHRFRGRGVARYGDMHEAARALRPDHPRCLKKKKKKKWFGKGRVQDARIVPCILALVLLCSDTPFAADDTHGVLMHR